MKRMTKILSIALSLGLVITSFVGCGNNKDDGSAMENSNTSTTSQSTEKKDPVKLVLWGGTPEENGPQAMVDKFNKIDPNVQLEYVRFVNDDSGNTKLDMALTSGQDIDVFITYNGPMLNKRIQSGSVMELGELANKVGMNLVDYFGTDIETTKTDGKYYYIPGQLSTDVILYNQKMFDDAGVPYPKVGWTYDEFIDASKKLTKGKGVEHVYGYYVNPWAEQIGIQSYMAKYGANFMYSEDGKSSAVDSPEIKQSIERYLSRVAEGIEPSYVDNKTQKMTPQDMLLTGKAAMVYGNWIVRYVKDTKAYPHDFKVGFATVPKLDASQDKLYTTGFGDFFSINTKSKNQEEAMKFLKWFSEEGTYEFVGGGRIPASLKVDQNKVAQLFFAGYEDLFDIESAKATLFSKFDLRVRTIQTAAQELNTIAIEEYEKCFAGAQSVEDTIKNIKKRSDEKITKALSEAK